MRYQPIKKKLENILLKYGISKIKFPYNKLIVGLCEVAETQPDSNQENDVIISVLRDGYHKEDEIIRAAEVVVVKN